MESVAFESSIALRYGASTSRAPFAAYSANARALNGEALNQAPRDGLHSNPWSRALSLSSKARKRANRPDCAEYLRLGFISPPFAYFSYSSVSSVSGMSFRPSFPSSQRRKDSPLSPFLKPER